jgi:phage FluMu protein Com
MKAEVGMRVKPISTSLGLYLRGFTMPRATIACGYCLVTFKAKVPRSSHPTVQCPHCSAWNELQLKISEDGMITPTRYHAL